MKPLSIVSKSAVLILFSFSALPLFAQHGGGGHAGGGGGFHGGGGGFHGGGGGFHGSSGGGGARSSGGFHGGSATPPAAGYGAPRASAPPAFRSGPGFASRPGYGGFSRPGGNASAGNRAPSGGNGQWHSFGPAAGERAPSTGFAAGAQSVNGNVRVMGGNRSAAPGAVRSFSGQGREVWESSASHNVISRSQSLSTMHSSLNNSLFARPGARGAPGFSSSAHFTGGSPLLANRGLAGGVARASSFQQIRGFGFNRFGYPSGGFRGGWHGGCWNCGFGFGNRWGWGFGGWGWGGWGLGWGWGSPWLGLGWGWSTFWYDPWWNWGWGGSGYYGYPTNNYYIYNYDGSGNYQPQDNSAPPAEENNNQSEDDYQGTTNGNWVTPNGPSPSAEPSASSLSVPVLIYMKNGSVLTVRDYWMIDGELHYIQMNGVQKSVDLEQVDLARSNAENAKSGVKFIFKSEPNGPTLNETPAPPAAQPDSSTPGPGVQPEART